jgi:hypothetical protein
VGLARGDEDVEALVTACDRVVLDEAEPRQHRHLTRAWFAQREGRWDEAAAEIDRARAAFVVSSPEGGGVRAAEARARTGDHTPHLLARLARLDWEGAAFASIEAWLQQIKAAAGQPITTPRPSSARRA